jgi:hypothetical protein
MSMAPNSCRSTLDYSTSTIREGTSLRSVRSLQPARDVTRRLAAASHALANTTRLGRKLRGMPRSPNGEFSSQPVACPVTGRFMRSITLACCLALLTLGRSQAQQAAESKAPENQAPANQAATFAGSEVCQACHEDLFNAIRKSPHGVLESDKKRGWEGKTCESCHGPGSKHAESTSPRRYPESGQARGVGNRPDLSSLPSQPAIAVRAHPQRPRQKPGRLCVVPFGARRRTRSGGAKGCGRQHAVR